MKNFILICAAIWCGQMQAQPSDSTTHELQGDTVRVHDPVLDNQQASLKYNEGVRALSESRFQDAEFLFSETIQLDPQYRKAWVNRAAVYVELERFADAESDYQKAIALNDSTASAHFGLGRLYDRQGRTDEAFESYNK